MTGAKGSLRPTRIVRILLVMLITAAAGFGAALPGRATAQSQGLIDDSTYRFGLGGTEIRWSEPWEFDPESSGQFEGYETAALISFSAGLLIGQIQADFAVDLDLFLAVVLDTFAAEADEFITVERSATTAVSYSLDAAIIDGIPTGLFTYVQPSPQTGTIVFTSLLSEYSTFADNIADAQENVTVNGRIALEGIDGEVLQNLLPPLEADPGTGEQSDPDNDSDVDSEGDDEEDDQPRTPPEFGDNSEDEEQEDSQGGTDIDDDLADLGIVDDGLYESPQFGTEIEWTGDWELDDELLSSDEDEEVDGIGLAINDGEAVIIITIAEAGDAQPADFAAFWESEDFLAENASPDAEVLLSDSTRSESAVLIADALDNGTELWALRQAYSLDGGDTIAIVLMVGLAASFPDRLADAQDGITIDGDPALTLFSVADVEDAA